ncbi:zeta toxin family protein [Rhodococcus aetherivorans]|uniref:zeta toxin family protein n=1 Tax=Rhodococcus aetherivorans TaxID=191292 RepID=UPI0013783577|nr:zeta toxin family protein [Rhodococcus aetherivorans]NGP29206.1 hypothetical protein [Rhodococcus aetherivorans]
MPGIDPGRVRAWRELDADIFKRFLLEAAVEDGTLQDLLPAQGRAQPGEGIALYPLELSALVHRESTEFLFAAAEREAVLDGENPLIDGTLAWKPHAQRLLTNLQGADYTIHVVDVEAPRQVAAERITARWRDGLIRAVEQPADPTACLGGRWVPETAVDHSSPSSVHSTRRRCTASLSPRSTRSKSAKNTLRSPCSTCIGPQQLAVPPSTSNGGNEQPTVS